MIRDADRLHEEIAFLAFHAHWSLGEVLDLEHPDRERYVAEIARLADRTR